VLVPVLLTLWALSGWGGWGEFWSGASYDSLFRLGDSGQPSVEDSPVRILYLDLNSYLTFKQNPALAWDRSLHARLVDRLRNAGARAVVFDILFTDPGPDPAADQALVEALRRSGRTLVAGEMLPSKQPGAKHYVVSPPLPAIRDAAAGWGFAILPVSEDFVVRRHYGGSSSLEKDSLVWAAGQFLNLEATRGPESASGERWMRYYGPPFTIPHKAYDEAMDPAFDAEFVRGRIVFIGARPMARGFAERLDEFRSPYRGWSQAEGFMPGVEVHATQMLNLIRQDWLRRLPRDVETPLLLATAALAGFVLMGLRPLPASFAALGAEVLVAGVAVASFARVGYWFPWLVVGGLQIPSALAVSVLVQSVDWYRQKRALQAARREAEATIREQAALIDKAQDAIVVRDLDGAILYANPSAERLYGWTLAELRSTPVSGQGPLAWQGTDAVAARETALRAGEWTGELDQKTRSGQTLRVASRWTLIRDEAGAPKSLLLINTDITEKRRLETQLLQAQRMETLGALASGMAHDLNNALAPILMGVQILKRKPQDGESQQMLSVLEGSCRRGADIVRHVLLFARGREGEQQRLNAAALLREMAQVVRQTFPAAIRVSVMAPQDLWAVRGNPTQLHQVLMNLCVNARDAMSAGGELSLAADNATLSPEDAARIHGATPGDYVVWMISDTGSGIPPEVLPRVFEPFFTTKPVGQGTGLGLPTVSRIVKAHRGFIDIKSEPGQGTTFEIYLPRDTAEAPAAAAAETIPGAVPPARGNGERVLVVDDEQAALQMIRATLVEQGYRVDVASSGPDALDLLRGAGEPVRLVLLDAELQSAPGEPLLAGVRGGHPGVPVIVMSGDIGGEFVASALRQPGVSALERPFGSGQLLTAVAAAIRG
jgi:PAS domain S-box-containing protein